RERSAARCRASPSPSYCRSALRLRVVRALAVIGPLSRDLVGERDARIGGPPWYAAKALRTMQQEAMVVAKCGEPERRSYLRRVEWVHVAPLLRGDFPPEALERIGRRRRVLLDGHGLVRARRIGPLAVDADFDRALLRHVSILKLSEEEAEAILGGGELEELRELGVPEVVVTFGAGGSLVLTRDATVRVKARPWSPPWNGGRLSCSRTTPGRPGAKPAAGCRRASPWRSPTTSPTGCSTPRATGSTSRPTAVSFGARSPSSCRTSTRSPGSTERTPRRRRPNAAGAPAAADIAQDAPGGGAGFRMRA